MPNYFFECTKEHIFEAIVSYETMLKGITCRSTTPKKCRAKAKVIYLSRSQAYAARHFAPTLLYMRADGEVVTPGRNDPSQLPKSYLKQLHKKGFKEVNLTTFREYEKFRRDYSEKLRSRADSYNRAEQVAYDNALNEQIDSLKRGGMVEFPNEDGSSRFVKIPPLEDMHPSARKFAEYAIEQARNKKFVSEDPNPFINAYENDRTYYRDKDTDWKRRDY